MAGSEGLAERVAALDLNPEAIERAEVFLRENEATIIPNVEGRRLALQVYAYITTNDGWIGREEAKKGLSIFGDELVHEARKDPEKHPNIYNLDKILESGSRIRVDIIRRSSAKHVPDYISERLPEIAGSFGTPFHIYDERAIRENARNLNNAFSWAPQFMNFFAVKACPNPFILKILKAEGFGADCSSGPELLMAESVGIYGQNIMFTSNNTPVEEFRTAEEMGAIINLDDLTHVDFLEKTLAGIGGIPEVICCRYNPGSSRVGNSIIGQPEEAKYGFRRDQLSKGYRMLRERGARIFGLHTMIASNELSSQYFVGTAKMLFGLVVELSKELGIRFDFVNLGGGIGTPYKPEQKPVDLQKVSEGIREAYEGIIAANKMHPLKIFMENGRMVTGPYGYLVSKVRHVMDKHKGYVGLDACMADLMRPALYGAYHHITVLGKEEWPANYIYDVSGSLCENNDKFAINRRLPLIKAGDMVIIHNAGAHGHAMGFNYNGKLRPKELLLRENGKIAMIRRAETADDYIRTLDMEELKRFKA